MNFIILKRCACIFFRFSFNSPHLRSDEQSFRRVQGHYDGVIHHFREMHVTSWPADTPDLKPIIDRIQAMCPTKDIQTHLVHLASDGEILPHVDNIHASGSWILGVSLGADRILCMQHSEDPNEAFKLLLPSGSLYIQRRVQRRTTRSSTLIVDRFHLGIRCDSNTSIPFSRQGHPMTQAVNASV